jgi:hypothetical protein
VQVRWAALIAWSTTAVFGLNLAVRGGAIRLLLRTRWKPTRRQAWSHRTLFLGHIIFAVAGLMLWVWYSIAINAFAAWLAGLAITLVAVHGLSLVERWIPGRGKHATGRSVDPTRRGYFPVFPATLHIIAATLTVCLVALTLLEVRL